MKRLISVLLSGFLVVIGMAWAADQAPLKEYTGSQQITTGPSKNGIYTAVVSYAGVTVGEKIQLIDSTSSTTAPVVLTVVAATANGSIPIRFTPTAGYFQNGIYYKETKSGGTFTIDMQQF